MIPVGLTILLTACAALLQPTNALFFGRPQARQNLRQTEGVQMHIFTFQKDENKFLLDWFNYHSNLVGKTGNIHVIDHSSTDPETLRILAHIKWRGGEVIKYEGNFTPGVKYTEVMRRHIKEPGFLVPLDGEIRCLSSSFYTYPPFLL